MKLKFILVGLVSILLLTGFTCSKHVPEKAPEASSETPPETPTSEVPQDQMSTDAQSTAPTPDESTTK